MKRHKPLKRSPFKAKLPERKQREESFPGVCIDKVHFGRYGSNEAHEPTPKFDYVRSAPLMRAYRKIACQGCSRNDGTVCGAHSNWAVHGKGKSVKASDIYCASLCFECHQSLDQGSAWTETERKEFWWMAHRLTVATLCERGQWPTGVPVPDTSQNPFAGGT
jgi:hypothetical protein